MTLDTNRMNRGSANCFLTENEGKQYAFSSFGNHCRLNHTSNAASTNIDSTLVHILQQRHKPIDGNEMHRTNYTASRKKLDSQ